MDDNKIEKKAADCLEQLLERYPALESQREAILKGYLLLEACYRSGGKLLVAGNGGSASDSEHIVGELMKGFKKARRVGDDVKEILTGIDGERGKLLGENLRSVFTHSRFMGTGRKGMYFLEYRLQEMQKM